MDARTGATRRRPYDVRWGENRHASATRVPALATTMIPRATEDATSFGPLATCVETLSSETEAGVGDGARVNERGRCFQRSERPGRRRGKGALKWSLNNFRPLRTDLALPAPPPSAAWLARWQMFGRHPLTPSGETSQQ